MFNKYNNRFFNFVVVGADSSLVIWEVHCNSFVIHHETLILFICNYEFKSHKSSLFLELLVTRNKFYCWSYNKPRKISIKNFKNYFVRSGIRTHALIRGPEFPIIPVINREGKPWVWRLRPLGHPDVLKTTIL